VEARRGKPGYQKSQCESQKWAYRVAIRRALTSLLVGCEGKRKYKNRLGDTWLFEVKHKTTKGDADSGRRTTDPSRFHLSHRIAEIPNDRTPKHGGRAFLSTLWGYGGLNFTIVVRRDGVGGGVFLHTFLEREKRTRIKRIPKGLGSISGACIKPGLPVILGLVGDCPLIEPSSKSRIRGLKDKPNPSCGEFWWFVCLILRLRLSSARAPSARTAFSLDLLRVGDKF